MHTTNAIVQAGVAGLMRNLSVSDDNRKQIIVAGGMEALVLSSQIHADNEKLQGEVAGALRNLAGEKSPREGEEGGAPAPAPAEASTAGIKPPVARARPHDAARLEVAGEREPQGLEREEGALVAQAAAERRQHARRADAPDEPEPQGLEPKEVSALRERHCARGPRAQPSQGLRLLDHGFGSDCVRLQ